ncbi:MAG: DNA polymerase III subunit gamma/tau [Roseburia sp.]|nr:DNA polymerase III subunit gamma/tau [Roseburia sp.]MCM1279444.1 DNA polymerase III subunit gamma/tau [Robinsoniella sp.]
MSYQALYRKFRPNNFHDVKGQEHIVTTLKNQITADRVGHAYLFCGTRGTGKTTIAKIFAKTVNCQNPIDGSPCGECASCKAIAAGASMNVIEIDAASNNGVDNIREIVDEVSYSPAEGKYKVYIIDEVHMLSIGAFNALLKTLEEPPSYVIFILATTEAHKIPITILSRCQRYDFKRITIDTIAGRLKELMAEEQVEVEEKALRYIGKAADGSMRDALSLLDQCIAFHFGEKLTYDMVLDVLGAVDGGVFSRMLRHMIDKDVLGCITLLEEMVMQGRELTQFVSDFIWYLRNLLLVKSSEHAEEIIEASTENMELLKEEAEMLEQNTIMRYIRIFSELSGQMRYATAKRILLEMTLIKVCRPAMETNQESLLERIRDLEEKVENGIPVAAANYSQTQATGQEEQVKKERPPMPKAVPEDVKAIVSKWDAIISRTVSPMKQYLKGARLSLGGDNRLMVVLQDGLPFDYFSQHPDNKKNLEELLSEHVGKEIQVTVQSIQRDENFDNSYVDLSRIIQMEIEEED